MAFEDYDVIYRENIRTQPYSNEAEAAVLGAIMISQRHISRAIELLDQIHFIIPDTDNFRIIQKLLKKSRN